MNQKETVSSRKPPPHVCAGLARMDAIDYEEKAKTKNDV
jgi:hypothetical protein